MLYAFAEIACVVFEVLLIRLFQRSFWEPQHGRGLCVPAAYLLFGAVIVGLSFVASASLLRMAVTVIGITALTCLAFEATVRQAVLSSLLFSAVYAANDVLVMVVLSLFGIDSQDVFASGSARMIYVIAAHLVLFAILAAVGLAGRGTHSMLSTRVVLLLSPCWVASILLCCLLISSVYATGMELHPLYIVVSVGLLYMNILMAWVMEKLDRQAQEQNESGIAAHHYALQTAYYAQLQHQQDEIRALWHDIQKQVRAVQIAQNAARPPQEWLELEDKLHTAVQVVDFDNHVVNVILNEYLHLARQADIRLEMDVQVAPELPFSAADLYVILGNTLDNALAACRALPAQRRTVSLLLRQHRNILYYRITNPFSPEHVTRPRTKNNGFGLKNVAKRIARYEGRCEAKADGGVFTFTAHINCPEAAAAKPAAAGGAAEKADRGSGPAAGES